MTGAIIDLNRRVLLVFAPILILTGIGGFILPPRLALMSGAAPYNVFHIIFGGLGLWLATRKGDRASAGFNLGFGALDLYQVLASRAHLFPERHFQWRTADDVAHVILGIGLVAVGSLAFRRTPKI